MIKNLFEKISFTASLLILVLGTLLLGFFHGLVAEYTTPFDVARTVYSVFVAIFIILTVYLVFLKSEKLQLFYVKIVNIFLGSYIIICVISTLMIGMFSPFILVGTLTYQNMRGVNTSLLFYPFLQPEHSSQDLKPIIIDKKGEKND